MPFRTLPLTDGRVQRWFIRTEWPAASDLGSLSLKKLALDLLSYIQFIVLGKASKGTPPCVFHHYFL
jgi:hypothetical protein